jgi:hypothetical protein
VQAELQEQEACLQAAQQLQQQALQQVLRYFCCGC